VTPVLNCTSQTANIRTINLRPFLILSAHTDPDQGYRNKMRTIFISPVLAKQLAPWNEV
jgi:hypothetical protein